MTVKELIEMFICAFTILCLLVFVFSLGIVYGLADCPNIIEWIKGKLGKETKDK